jgi:zinc/manganese transport system permease protein
MWQFEFMQNAFLAGSAVAIVAGVVGVFAVAKGETFMTHVLSEIGFAGAAFGLFAGWPPLAGMLLFNTVSSLTIGQLEAKDKRTDMITAAVSAIAIGLGVAFLTLSGKSSSGAMSIMFGSVFSLTRGDTHLLIALSGVILLLCGALLRPLKHYAFDADTAEYTLPHFRLLGMAFTVLIAMVVAISAQAVGALLIFILVTLPAGVALRRGRSVRQMLIIAVSLALGGMWLALLLAYWTNLPVSVYLALIEAAAYLSSLRR